MNNCVILAGSNIKDREKAITDSLSLFEKEIGKISKQSSLYESEPWGYDSRNWFLNQAWLAKTEKIPLDLLEGMLFIEKEVGRERKGESGYKDRIIDLDLIFFENFIIEEPNLKVPHPALSDRMFVLLPMNEIIPDYVHPVFKKPVKELLVNCKDKLTVRLFEPKLCN